MDHDDDVLQAIYDDPDESAAVLRLAERSFNPPSFQQSVLLLQRFHRTQRVLTELMNVIDENPEIRLRIVAAVKAKAAGRQPDPDPKGPSGFTKLVDVFGGRR